MPYEPPTQAESRRARATRWVGFAIVVVLILLVGYLGYVGYEASRQLVDAPNDSMDCRTPATFGWAYEAINYDIVTDDSLAEEPDQLACPIQGEEAGEAVVGPGDIGLAGWYIPSASGTGPTGPTVVIAHGWSSNKSAMLERASILHPAYNLLILDFRNHGQSERANTTQGVREAGDLEAMIDWLVEAKAPLRIALLGVSMGGATVLNEADDDERIAAVIVESTHATLANAIQARLDGEGYPLSLPGSWAALLGTLLRTGEDLSAADPVQAIARLDDRPVLVITGGEDAAIGGNDAEDLRAAAEEAGSPVELETCAEAGHAEAPETCADAYADWVLGFLARVLPPT